MPEYRIRANGCSPGGVIFDWNPCCRRGGRRVDYCEIRNREAGKARVRCLQGMPAKNGRNAAIRQGLRLGSVYGVGWQIYHMTRRNEPPKTLVDLPSGLFKVVKQNARNNLTRKTSTNFLEIDTAPLNLRRRIKISCCLAQFPSMALQ